jgi:hypothetical protein
LAVAESAPPVRVTEAVGSFPPGRVGLEQVPELTARPDVGERVSLSEKGSVLVYPKVEMRWDANENLYVDTFISLTNDYEAPVELLLYFVREECTHVDVHTDLTRNQPAYWAASTGLPGPDGAVLPPFGTLGNAILDAATGEFYLRGYLLVIAVNAQGEQIRWNHLLGEATITNYRDGTAWAYSAYAFATKIAPHGGVVGTPGVIEIGTHYDTAFDQLLLDFYAPGSGAFLGGTASAVFSVVDTDLTLMILQQDLRLLTEGPFRTLVMFETWDENETGLTGDAYCFQKWCSMLLSVLGGHFATLQTDRGYSRLDAISDESCDVWVQPFPGQPPVLEVASIDTPLLGVQVKLIDWFDLNGMVVDHSAAGGALRGFGTQPTTIQFDVTGGGGGEKAGGGDPAPQLPVLFGEPVERR